MDCYGIESDCGHLSSEERVYLSGKHDDDCWTESKGDREGVTVCLD